MSQRLISGVLLVGLVVGAQAQTTGPLAVEERTASSSRSTAAGSTSAVSQDGVMLLVQQLQMLEQELANLRGQTETLTQELEVMRQAERERFIDLDTRINALASSVTTGTTTGTAAESAGSSASNGDKDPEADRAAYKAAKDKLVSGKSGEAAAAFEQYLVAFPDGQFASYSHFWLGEIYRGMGAPKRDLAISHLKAVTDKYPDSAKVSAAMYKLAVLEYESGDQTRAKVTLNKLLKQYPGSSEAGLAKSMLDQLK